MEVVNSRSSGEEKENEHHETSQGDMSENHSPAKHTEGKYTMNNILRKDFGTG
jgi:hypothetical protein